MSNDFDDSLRAALRPVDPGKTFTQNVMSRIASEPTQAIPTRRVPLPARMPAMAYRWLAAAAVASVALGGLFAHQWQVRRTQQGLKARQDLIEALRVTGEKLDLVYHVVHDQESSGAPQDSAANQNSGA